MNINLKKISFCVVIGFFLNSSLANADTLKEAIIQTIKTNPDVLYSIKGWLASEQGIDKSKGGYLPKLDVTADVGKQNAKNEDNNFEYGNYTTTGAGVSLRQLVFDGFATSSDIASNKSHTLAASYQVQATANDTALLAAKAYLDVLTNQKIVSLAQDNYATMQSIADIAQHKGNKADVSLAKGRVALAKADLLTAQNNYTDAQTAYYKIVGAVPQNLVMPSEPTEASLPANRITAVKEAVSNHPLLKSSEASINESRARYEGSKSNYYPRVDAVLGARVDDNLDGVDGNQVDEVALLELSYNLFNGGSDLASQKQSGYLVEQAQKTHDLAYNQVVEKAKLSWDELDTAKSRISYLKEHWNAVDISANAYYGEYKKGNRSLVDLLNTEEELYQAKVDYANGQSNLLFSKYWVLNSEGFLLSYFQVPSNVSATGTAVVQDQVQQQQVSTVQQQTAAQPVTKPSAATTTTQQQPSKIIASTDSSAAAQTQATTPSTTSVATPKYKVADTRISKKAANKYTIQIYTSYDKEDAINFIVKNNIQTKAAFYMTKEGSKNKYVVVYGSYIDQNSATAAINAMPLSLKTWGPTIKQLGKVQEDIAK